MKKVFKWLLVTLVIPVAAVAALLYNPNLVKGPLQRHVSQLTGYPVTLAGDIGLSVGRVTQVSVTDLQVAAPAWSSDASLITIGRLFVSFDIATLFKETVIVNSVEVEGALFKLETSDTGHKNWQVEKDQTRDDTTPGVIIRDIRLTDVTLSHLSRGGALERVFHIQGLGQRHRADGMLDLSLTGSLNGRAVHFNGEVGPFDKFLKGQNISYSGRGNFGNLDIRGKGLIDDLSKPRRPQFDLQIQGQNIDEITAMLGIEDLGSGDFSLKAMGGEVAGQYEAGINGKIGHVLLDFSARVKDLVSLDDLDLELAAKGPNLGAATRALGIQHWPDQPFSLQGSARRIGRTLDISQLRLDIGGSALSLDAQLNNFPELDSSRVRLGIKGDDMAQFHQLLGVKGSLTGPFEVQGHLDVSPQHMELLQVEVATTVGQMSLSGTLGAAPDYTGSRLHLSAVGEDAHRLMSVFDLDFLPEEPYRLDAFIETTKNGLRIENNALVTIRNERLELEGFVSIMPGSKGTDLEVNIHGQHPQTMLHRLVPGFEFTDHPYDLVGRLRVLDDGINFDGFTARIADIELTADGLISQQSGREGAHFQVSAKGPDLHGFIKDKNLSALPVGVFRSSAKLDFSVDALQVSDFIFEAPGIRGKLNLNLNLPVGDVMDMDFDIDLKGDDIRQLVPPNDWFEPSLAAYQVRINGHKQADRFSLQQFDMNIGNSDIGGTLEVFLAGEKPVIELHTRSRLIDLGSFLASDQDENQDKTKVKNTRVIPPSPLPMDALDAVDFTFRLAADELSLPLNKVNDLVLEGETSAGALNIPRLSWTGVQGSKALGSLTVVPLENGPADVNIDFGVENAMFRYTGLTRGQPWLTPEMDILFQASGRGANLQELAGSINGSLFIGSEGGTLKDVNLSLLDTFILDEVFRLIFAKSDADEDDLTLTCAAATLRITDGLVKTDPAYAFTTDKIRLIAKGTLDLKTEALNINFSATPRNVLHVSFSELLNPYILVSGNLKQPEVGIDPARALLHGGAAIGTSGISILAKAALDRIGATTPVCQKMLEKAR